MENYNDIIKEVIIIEDIKDSKIQYIIFPNQITYISAVSPMRDNYSVHLSNGDVIEQRGNLGYLKLIEEAKKWSKVR